MVMLVMSKECIVLLRPYFVIVSAQNESEGEATINNSEFFRFCYFLSLQLSEIDFNLSTLTCPCVVTVAAAQGLPRLRHGQRVAEGQRFLVAGRTCGGWGWSPLTGEACRDIKSCGRLTSVRTAVLR